VPQQVSEHEDINVDSARPFTLRLSLDHEFVDVAQRDLRQ